MPPRFCYPTTPLTHTYLLAVASFPSFYNFVFACRITCEKHRCAVCSLPDARAWFFRSHMHFWYINSVRPSLWQFGFLCRMRLMPRLPPCGCTRWLVAVWFTAFGFCTPLLFVIFSLHTPLSFAVCRCPCPSFCQAVNRLEEGRILLHTTLFTYLLVWWCWLYLTPCFTHFLLCALQCWVCREHAYLSAFHLPPPPSLTPLCSLVPAPCLSLSSPHSLCCRRDFTPHTSPHCLVCLCCWCCPCMPVALWETLVIALWR